MKKRVKTQDLQPGDVLIRPFEGMVVAKIELEDDRVVVTFEDIRTGEPLHTGRFFYDKPWKIMRRET